MLPNGGTGAGKSKVMKKVLTLCVIHQDFKILLAMKKRGFGVGRWNGFGGKVEAGETLEGAAKRECFEEGNIIPLEIQEVGVIDFKFKGGAKEILEVHIFRAENFKGEPAETEEMLYSWKVKNSKGSSFLTGMIKLSAIR
jgi:8-oxo-dGTP diphosphatase/2-hydroxy-dATP diphosphatase